MALQLKRPSAFSVRFVSLVSFVSFVSFVSLCELVHQMGRCSRGASSSRDGLLILQKSARPREAAGWTHAGQRSFAALRMTKPLAVTPSLRSRAGSERELWISASVEPD